jgi:hypothetical protein
MGWDDKIRAGDARHLLGDTVCCQQTVMAASLACASFQGIGVRHLLNVQVTHSAAAGWGKECHDQNGVKDAQAGVGQDVKDVPTRDWR